MSLKVENLKIGVGGFCLGPLSVDFGDRGIHLIRGKNGAGKTTFLRTLLGRLRPRSGETFGLSGPIGAVGVEPLLMGAWSVEENIRWFSSLLGKPVKLPPEIAYCRYHRADHLSQGMRRQVELSLILSLGFSILFFDEPLSPLDRTQREVYATRIRQAAESALVLLTTHFDEHLFGEPQSILELS